MSVTMLISLFMKGWDWCVDTLIPFLWKYKAIFIFMGILTYTVYLKDVIKHKDEDIQVVQKEFQDYKFQQQVEYTTLLTKASARESELLNKHIQIERKYNDNMAKVNADYVATTNVVNGLRQQLTENKQRLSQLSEGQVRAYTSSLSDTFEYCTSRYKDMAKVADDHRVAEERAVTKYNALIDTYNKPLD